ncbi:HAD family hydrolase [Sporosalibacterium faouarense]|uniref:HAD family hydrolase n=1 Tax=Sporosalibacterium faouarense TaxID=516123 RepID=UPI00141C1CF2|nr:HAD family hydrolase [Sporosalibacterium faouarense]MTI49429.1 HAD family hydrolase [Bacillota bacterium]
MKAVLFDLDGTLLPLDMEEFTQAYFAQLATKLSSHINPKDLPGFVWASTKYMISNLESNKTNEEAFFEDFATRIDNKLEELHPIFEEFYKEDFKNLRSVVKPNILSKEIINELKRKNYDLVVATNPLFPKEAIHHRIQWAGLDINDFKLITTYENMHFCKPNLEYYEEILKKIGHESKDIMMVGNDMEEDIIASKLGIKTFLIEDYIIDRETEGLKPDYRGSMEDLYNHVKELPLRSES